MTEYLDSLSIKNFRSYKEAKIDFHPGLNIIVGPNDSGKSNILRVIDWIVNNSPDGDDYISNFGGDCLAELTTGGKTVGRFRNAVFNKKEEIWRAGTENIYTLSGEPEPFRAFGRKKLPEIIKQHLNISDLNIGFQLDGPFLLGKSPADVARFYNGLVNLDIIDRSISNIATVLRKEKGELKVVEAIVESKTEELKKYAWLNDAEKGIKKLEKTENYLKHLNSKWSALAGLIEKLKNLKGQEQELNKIVKYEKLTNDLNNKKIAVARTKQKQSELSGLIKRLVSLLEQKEKNEKIIKWEKHTDELIALSKQINDGIDKEEKLGNLIDKLKKYQEIEKQYKMVVKYGDSVKALLVLKDKIDEGISKHRHLTALIESKINKEKEHKALGIQLLKYENEFQELMPDVCPLCGR